MLEYENRGGFQDLRVGRPDSYLHINRNGVLRLVGGAAAYDDLRIDGLTTTVGVVAPTDENGFLGDSNHYVRNFVHNQADEVQFTVQLPHSWSEGTTIHPHVHFSPWITNAGDAAARFVLEYYWANVNDAFPASPSMYTMTKNWTGDAQWNHLIAGGESGIDATGKTLSSILKCRLYRDNTVTNNLAGKVTFLYFDIHFAVNSFGSDEEYIKT